jgi:membrane protein CcdC involved in cytochrome C biogenesis
MSGTKTTATKILRERVIGFPVAMIEALFLAVIVKVWMSHEMSTKSIPTIIFLLLISAILVITFLAVLYIYRFKKLEKYILNNDPGFYEHREFDRWYEYYVNQTEKEKPK